MTFGRALTILFSHAILYAVDWLKPQIMTHVMGQASGHNLEGCESSGRSGPSGYSVLWF